MIAVSAVVLLLTKAEFLDLYKIRPLLDVGALRLAGIAPPSAQQRLRDLNERLHRAEGAMERIIIDDEWHLLLVEGFPQVQHLAAGNARSPQFGQRFARTALGTPGSHGVT